MTSSAYITASLRTKRLSNTRYQDNRICGANVEFSICVYLECLFCVLKTDESERRNKLRFGNKLFHVGLKSYFIIIFSIFQ